MTSELERRLSAPIKWVRRNGRGFFNYDTAETYLGRIRVSRINKNGVPGFRAYLPDGKHITMSTPDEAKRYAEDYVRRALATNPQSEKEPTNV